MAYLTKIEAILLLLYLNDYKPMTLQQIEAGLILLRKNAVFL